MSSVKGKKKGKKRSLLKFLVSTAGTGVFFMRQRNEKLQDKPLKFKKYDPVKRQHVLFEEQKKLKKLVKVKNK